MSRWMLVGLLLLAAQVSWSANMDRGPVRVPRRALDVANPQDENYVLNNGTLALNFTNWGFFGNDGYNQSGSFTDPCTDEWAPQFEYPLGSGANYLWQGALWVGAEVETEDGTRIKRVSVGTDGWQNPSINEFHAGESPGHGITLKSNLEDATDCFGNSIYDPSARANIEAIAVFTDTLSDDFWVRDDPTDGPHVPIGLEITQTARLWSSPEFARFVILEFEVRNISPDTIFDPVLGLYLDGDIGVQGVSGEHTDDITGALLVGEGTGRTLGWIADNDGRSRNGAFALPHAMGFAGLSISEDSLSTNQPGSYNWWNPNADHGLDYGPSWTDSPDWTVELGTPEGDWRKYEVLTSGEHDFAQYALLAVHPEQNDDYACHPGSLHNWRGVDIDEATQRDIADGYDCRFMLSWTQFGIYDHIDQDGKCHFRLAPGESSTFTSALLIGENFHDAEHPQPDPSHLDSTLFDYTGLIASYDQARRIFDADYSFQPPTPPLNLWLGAAMSNTLMLFWDAPNVGGAEGFRIYGRPDSGQGERVTFTQNLVQPPAYPVTGLTNGDDWLLEVVTYDAEGNRSVPAQIMARVGAIPNRVTLHGRAVTGCDSLYWEEIDAPSFTHCTLKRTSVEDTVLFENITANYFVDHNVVSGRVYEYTLLLENTLGVTSLPGNAVVLTPYAPTASILVYDETRTPTQAELLRMFVPDTLVSAFYRHLLEQINEPYEYVDLPTGSNPLSLETIAQYQIVIWHSENPGAVRTSPQQPKVEPILSEYVVIGGKLIRFGRNVLIGTGALPGIQYGESTLERFAPLEFDSVWAAPLYLNSNHFGDVRTIGATNVDGSFPTLTWDEEKLAELRYLNITDFEFLPGVDFYWRRGNTWNLYNIVLSESDTSGFGSECCGVIGPGVIAYGFPLYFVEEDQAGLLLSASLDALRTQVLDSPELPLTPLPTTTALHQNYPNPFNPNTTIEFEIPATTNGSLKIYNVRGQLVETLMSGTLTAGYHSLNFNAERLSTGLYFYRLEWGDHAVTKKMLLIR